MPTGACGVHCDVCKLKLMEICSTCGPGKSPEAARKIEAQKRLLGAACPILECARMNRVDYCLRDCDQFPCDNFKTGPYPFSQGFLDMQKRRRKQLPPGRTHHGTPIQVPEQYWEELRARDASTVCAYTGAEPRDEGGLVFRCLGEDVLVDSPRRRLKRFRGEQWEVLEDPLLELLAVLYFKNVQGVYAMGRDMVTVKDLKEAHYFKGPHALKLGPFLERFGADPRGFREAAEKLEGEPLDMADAAYRFLPFPRVPVYFLLWEGDEELSPEVSVLFDRSIQEFYAAPAVRALVELVTRALLMGGLWGT